MKNPKFPERLSGVLDELDSSIPQISMDFKAHFNNEMYSSIVDKNFIELSQIGRRFIRENSIYSTINHPEYYASYLKSLSKASKVMLHKHLDCTEYDHIFNDIEAILIEEGF